MASKRDAREDLRDKMRFERLFRQDLTAYFELVVREFVFKTKNKLPFNIVNTGQDRLAALLIEHYERVEKPFSTRIRGVLPREIASTLEEDRAIASTLKIFNGIRSQLQAKNINETTQKNINNSMDQARTFDDETDKLEDGIVIRQKQGLVGFELILTAGAILKRRLKGRLSGIVTTETQVAAEVSKLTEAEVLSGLIASISGGDNKPTVVTKIWVSQGDSVVRDTHLIADGQEVKANKPFIVGDFPLKVPGDTSLGAPLTETAGCRCAAVFNDEDIIAIRFDKLLEEPFMVRG